MRTSVYLFTGLVLLSCQQRIDPVNTNSVETQSAARLNDGGHCFQTLAILGELTNVVGTIVQAPSITPAIYGIEAAAPQSVGGYPTRLFVPCNLPESFKKVGALVTVSGQVLTYGTDEESRIDLFGQPLDITAIRAP